jgi:mannose-6-phosphate isomerase-like protein (cupin superfamily)
MSGFVTNIEQDTLANEDFRRVLFTGPHTQLVLMTLQPGEDIGRETHEGIDQFIRVESGEGKALLDGTQHQLGDGSAVVIPAGVEHNIINTSSSTRLRLYTLYSPPEHADGTVHRTKREAEAAHH